MKTENLHLSQTYQSARQASRLQRLTEAFAIWQRRAHERAELAQLDAWAQRDLGLSDSDIWREAGKPWWQA